MRNFAVGLMMIAALSAFPACAQTAAAKSPYMSVLGTVTKVDAASKTIAVKTTAADTSVKFDDKTSFIALPPGETDVTKGKPMKADEIVVGDRIVARVLSSDPTGAPALRAFINRQADIAQRDQKTLEEWRTQSVSGAVASVDVAAKKIAIKVRGAAGAPPKDVTVDASGRVTFQRYSSDTGKYEAGDLSGVKAGDQLRVIGAKNADVTEIKAEAIQTNNFLTIPAEVKSIDAGSMTVTAVNPATKKPVTITVKAYTTMKRLDDGVAFILARRLNPSFQGTGGRGGRGGAPGAAPGGDTHSGDTHAAEFAGGRGRGGQGGGAPDPARMIESQPNIQIADLKPGESLIITGIPQGDAAKLVAVSLTAGVEQILRAAPQGGPDPLGGGWNFGEVAGQ